MTEYIETLPLANTPEVFGLHPNAEIGYYTNAAKEMWTHLVELQPQTGKPAVVGYEQAFTQLSFLLSSSTGSIQYLFFVNNAVFIVSNT